jgi:hypothetical protein
MRHALLAATKVLPSKHNNIVNTLRSCMQPTSTCLAPSTCPFCKLQHRTAHLEACTELLPSWFAVVCDQQATTRLQPLEQPGHSSSSSSSSPSQRSFSLQPHSCFMHPANRLEHRRLDCRSCPCKLECTLPNRKHANLDICALSLLPGQLANSNALT